MFRKFFISLLILSAITSEGAVGAQWITDAGQDLHSGFYVPADKNVPSAMQDKVDSAVAISAYSFENAFLTVAKGSLIYCSAIFPGELQDLNNYSDYSYNIGKQTYSQKKELISCRSDISPPAII